MNGITYYQTRSPYRGDFTKNCSLNGFEIDSNFLNLEGRDIRRMYTRGCTLYAELYNGETISTTIDSCGGGSGSGSCDCEREINYLESRQDINALYDFQLEDDINFTITVPCRFYSEGLYITGEARSNILTDIVITPVDEEMPSSSFEIHANYQGDDVTMYTEGTFLYSNVYATEEHATLLGTSKLKYISGSCDGELNEGKDNIFKFPVSSYNHESGNLELLFRECGKSYYSERYVHFFNMPSPLLLNIDIHATNVIDLCFIGRGPTGFEFEIGIFWVDSATPQPQEVDLMTSITWSELKSLRDNSQLTPGMQYRITDYECTTAQTDTQSAGHPFDIIVFADDEHTLNENARAAKREGYIPKVLNLNYNVTVNIAKGSVSYYPGRYEGENESLFITQHDGTNYIKLLDGNNDIYYVNSVNNLYDSNFESTGEGVEFTNDYVSKWCGYLNAIQDGVEDINGTVYVRWQITSYNTNNGGINSDDIFGLQNINYVYSLSDNPTELSEVLCNVNDNVSDVFVRLALSYDLIDVPPNSLSKYRLFVPTLSITDESVYFANCNLEAWELKYCLDNDANRFAWAMGNATIHIYGKYEYDHNSYNIDLTANFAGDTRIIDGETYYVFRYDDTVTNTIEYPFSIDGTGVYDVSMIYYKTNDLSQSPFSNDELQASKIYVYNEANSPLTTDILNIIQTNIAGTYTYTSSSNEGKGVIYYMKDDRNNELPYDFKNIMFKRTIYGSDVMLYTFTQTKDGTISDASVYKNSSPKEGVFENIINPYYTDYNNSVRRSLNQNVFYSSGILLAHTNTFGINCYSNTFGNGCYSNVFGYFCHSNTFGDGYHSNKFGDNCFSNVFGDGCHSNTFGDGYTSNVFGDYCFSNTFGDDCHSNVFGDGCHSNVFGDGCHSNTFGDGCTSNVFGDYCFFNAFGNSCHSNVFGNDCTSNVFDNKCASNVFGYKCDSNVFGIECDSNTFGNDCSENTLSNDARIFSFPSISVMNTQNNDYYLVMSITVEGFNDKNVGGASNNSFGNNCEKNVLFHNCNFNKFGNECYKIELYNSEKSTSSWNTFGNGCSHITFGENIEVFAQSPTTTFKENAKYGSGSFNTFGNGCSYITLYPDLVDTSKLGSSYNSFGNGCSEIYLGMSSNEIGTECYYTSSDVSITDECFIKHIEIDEGGIMDDMTPIKVSLACNGNSFGNNCEYIIVSTAFDIDNQHQLVEKPSNYNTFGENVTYTMLKNNIKYATVLNGTNNNTDNKARPIGFAQDVLYPQYAGITSDNPPQLRVWNPADLALPPQQP